MRWLSESLENLTEKRTTPHRPVRAHKLLISPNSEQIVAQLQARSNPAPDVDYDAFTDISNHDASELSRQKQIMDAARREYAIISQVLSRRGHEEEPQSQAA